MIIWQSAITDDMVAGMDPDSVDEMIDELNDAVAAIVESYSN